MVMAGSIVMHKATQYYASDRCITNVREGGN